MSDNSAADLETADAAKVERALESLMRGDEHTAERLLQEVIANTPARYSNMEDDGDGLRIKFWNEEDFVHYVMWHKAHNRANRNITWILNAYPRAHFYMGFLRVKQKRFDEAIEHLDNGLALEPSNPQFVTEKALALVNMGRQEDAIALYAQVDEDSPFVSARARAIAQRGRGFVLIEMHDLDGAEAAFKASLELEPDSEVALNELTYIAHLRAGGGETFTQTIATSGTGVGKCAVCDREFQKGLIIPVNERPVPVCDRCVSKLTKKWWQFWK